MLSQKYPHSNIILRSINSIFCKLPNKSTLHYYGILLKKNLDVALPTFEKNEFIFKQADTEDIKAISKNPESQDFLVYRKRLLKGHVCYCAKYKNEIMSYVWFSFRTCGLFFGTDNEIELLSLNDKQAYSYNLYTYKKFRHQGVASKLHKYCNLQLKDNGYKERLSMIGPSFIASMKIAFKNDFVPLRIIYVFGVKKIIRAFVSTDKHSNKLNEWKNWFESAHNVKT